MSSYGDMGIPWLIWRLEAKIHQLVVYMANALLRAGGLYGSFQLVIAD